MGATRRSFLSGLAAGLSLPAAGHAANGRASVLRFIPRNDVGVLDPHWTTSGGTRNHAFLVFDTLYGVDSEQRPQPQMVAGHGVEDEGRRWTLTLRPGLRFHDGEPVLARDCVASIQRWARRDPFGQELLSVTADLSAPDDRTILFRLKRPFPLLPAALGKSQAYVPAIMPARLANADPAKQLREMVGSGPFRFKADEWNPGARVVYERFDGYIPRAEGTPSGTAGPKRVYFDRVEWNVVNDPGTALATLKAGEAEWLDYLLHDLVPSVKGTPGIEVTILEPSGIIGIMRLNHLLPPFDNPAIRRALLGAIDQSQYMRALAGDDTAMWRAPVGVFCPGTPMANDAGMEVFTTPRDLAKVRRDILAAGYGGEKVAVLVPMDSPTAKALSDVAVAAFRGAGLVVDEQDMDWATVQQRRTKMDPVAQGGWNMFCTNGWNGTDMLDPVAHTSLRGNGRQAWFGWPDSPRLEALRQDWMAASTLPQQQGIAAAIQRQCWVDVPYIPLGQSLQPTAYRRTIGDILPGFPTFWNVRPTI